MRVLAIDDDADIRSFVRAALEDEGHDVQVAPDGKVGLRLAQAFAPEVILLDMNMPVMNGPEFVRAYSEVLPPPEHAAIIVITAAPRGDVAARARQLAAAGYLGKPFELQDLVDGVEAAGAGGPPHVAA
jgi:DNA-binding response OmpR family regulator